MNEEQKAEWAKRQVAELDQRAVEQATEREAKKSAWAAQHEAELEQRRLARVFEREERREANAQGRTIKAPDVEAYPGQAKDMGLTLDELADLKDTRRKEMTASRNLSYEDQLNTAPKVR